VINHFNSLWHGAAEQRREGRRRARCARLWCEFLMTIHGLAV
jgi:hypothetical protein